MSSRSDPSQPPGGTIDAAEVDRFAGLAAQWWDPHGKFRPLHQLAPARLSFIRQAIDAHFGCEPASLKPLAGRSALDVGCGGGLVAEPICRLGAATTGIDPAAASIAVARQHAAGQGLAISYRDERVEALAGRGETFDLVLCLEVVEHVPDPAAFIRMCAGLVKPGGLLVLSTLNRTLKAWALAIVGAEYVLRWLPRGTHQWERFITPEELAGWVRAAGLGVSDVQGIVYNPLADRWSLSADTDVNYMLAAARPPI